MFLPLVSSAPPSSFYPGTSKKNSTLPPRTAAGSTPLRVLPRKTRAKDFGTDDKIFSQSLKAGQNIWTGGVGDRHKQGGFPRLNPLNQVKAFGLAFYDDWCYYRYTS